MKASNASPLRSGQRFPSQVYYRAKRRVLRAGVWAWLVVAPARAEESASPTESAAPASEPAPSPQVESVQPSAESCVDAHEKAVDQADTEHLLEAREEFAVCVSATCPRVIREECASELSRLRTRIPTVVFVAKDGSGKDVSEVTVALDGKSLLRGLTSRAIPLNPGRYEFVLTAADGRTVTEPVLLREGEQQRRVEVQFPGATSLDEKRNSVPTDAAASPWTAPVVVSAMLGTLGIVSFGYFALAGTAVEGCSPNCTGEEVSALRRDYAIADLSLLVGIAGLTTAVLLYESPDGREASAGLQARPDGGLQLKSTWRF